MEGSCKKAGIIIIGDEIMKGQVPDSNSTFLCKRFHAVGVKVCRVTTVHDEIEEIAEEVERFSEKYDIVITSGGIGPTHDDITYEAIALAFKDRIVLHSEMADVITSYFDGSSAGGANPALKMALIPQSSKLIYVLPKTSDEDPDSGTQTLENCAQQKRPFPVVQVRNVYVLPGMSVWLEHAFNHLENIFRNPSFCMYSMAMFLKSSELNIVRELNNAVNKFENQVLFGSYATNKNNPDYQTKITLESLSLDDVTAAYSYLASSLPKEYFPSEPILEEASLVYELTRGVRPLSLALRESLKVIEKALSQYTSEEIYLSFNGGKDCTVLVHLVWAVGKKMKNLRIFNAIYIRSEESFPEVERFIVNMAKFYKLNVLTVLGPIKDALGELYMKNRGVQAIFMGTRRTDPHAADLKDFQLCDKDWPPIMRVNPILDWSYEDVWNFLRILNISYCELYDEGYTSIGSPQNTGKNPALKVSKSENKYLPAYKLKDVTQERMGRY